MKMMAAVLSLTVTVSAVAALTSMPVGIVMTTKKMTVSRIVMPSFLKLQLILKDFPARMIKAKIIIVMI